MNQVTMNKHNLQEQKCLPPHVDGEDLECSHSEHPCGLKIRSKKWDKNVGDMIESAQEPGFQASGWQRDIGQVTGHMWSLENSLL